MNTSNKKNIKKMKKVTFKKEFTSLNEALTKVPKVLRENDNVFVLTDGNKTYKVKWEGSLTEGKAVALEASDKTQISEEVNRMKRLWGYKSEDTLGTPKGIDRINENEKFIELVSLKKKRLAEAVHGGHATFHNGGDVGPSFENTLGRPLDNDGIKEEIIDEGFAENLRSGALTLTAILGFINANAQNPEKLEQIKDTISQNADSKMVQDLKNATGIEFTEKYANDTFEYQPPKADFKHEKMADLYLGKYKDINVAKLTGKNRTEGGGLKYIVDISDKRYIDTQIFNYIASQNKKLKGATIEFTLNGSPMASKTIHL